MNSENLRLQDIGETVTSTFVNAVSRIVSFIPELLAGSIILIAGWFIAALLRKATVKALDVLKVRKYLDDAGFNKKHNQDTVINLLGQLVFWTVMIIFLIPALEAWNLVGVTDILNQIFLYIPRVLTAVIVGFVGYIIAKLAGQTVLKAAKVQGARVAGVLSNLTYYSILTFTGLVVLNQLGIAENLIQILFGAIMFSLALAGGLAFGLGGRDHASRVLDNVSQVASRRPTK